MKLSLLMGLMMFSLVMAVSFVSAQALIKTEVPSVVVADGVTEYPLRVWADNTGLNGDATRGVQWTVNIPIELQPYMSVTRVEFPNSSVDFFEGNQMVWWDLGIDMFYEARAVSRGDAKSNKQGYLATYYFTLQPGFKGRTSFGMGDILFLDQDVNEQPYVIENDEFTVVRKPALKSGNMLRCVGVNC
ncbi:MAG: hypothetical protein AABX53_00895 [Nanoarchaeota archaeon]